MTNFTLVHASDIPRNTSIATALCCQHILQMHSAISKEFFFLHTDSVNKIMQLDIYPQEKLKCNPSSSLH